MPEPITLSLTALRVLVQLFIHVRAAKETARLNCEEVEYLFERVRDGAQLIKSALGQELGSADAALDEAISNIIQRVSRTLTKARNLYYEHLYASSMKLAWSANTFQNSLKEINTKLDQDLNDLHRCISLETWRLVRDIPARTAAASAAFQLRPQMQGALAELQQAAGGQCKCNCQVVMWMAQLTVGPASQQEQALWQVNDFIEASPFNREGIAAAGMVPLLLELLEGSRGAKLQKRVSLAICTLCLEVSPATSVVKAGGVPMLVRLLRSSGAALQAQAALALANLAEIAEHRAAIAVAGAIPALVGLLESKEEDTQWHAACAFANLAAESADHKMAIVSAGAISPLVRLLESRDKGTQAQAALALAHLTELAEHRAAIALAGAISPLVGLLESKDEDTQGNAVRALANLAIENADHKTAIESAGATPALVRLLESKAKDTQAVENENPHDRVVHVLEQAVLAHGRPAPAVADNSPKSNTPRSLDSSAATYAALSPSPPAVAPTSGAPWGFDSAPTTPPAPSSGPTPHHYTEQQTPVPNSAPRRHERAAAVVLKPSPAGLLFGGVPEVAGVAASSSTGSEGPSGVCSMSASQLADVFARWDVQPGEAPDAGQPIKPTGNVRQWFRKLCAADSGILYEDNYIQVGVRSSYQGPSGQISLCLNNKHTRSLQHLVCNVRPTPALSLQLGPVPADLEPRQEVVVPLSVACSAPFMRPPVLHLGYTVAGTSQAASITLDLPMVLTKFCTPMEVPRDLFNAKWDQVAGPPLKLSEQVTKAKPIFTAEVKNLLASINIMPLPVLWSEPSIISAACIFHCGKDQVRHIPCAVRIEMDTMDWLYFAVTVTSADASTTESLKTELCQLIAEMN